MSTLLHSQPLGDGRKYDFDLDTAPQWMVRDAVRTLLLPGAGVVIDDAVQLVAELVANACQHGSSPRRCRLLVLADPPRLRVEVDDSHPGVPVARTPDRTGGRGIILVNCLATDWGCVRGSDIKTVWAELALVPAARSH
ncbi:ATP-binding protein [Nocardia sp. NPDC003693]